MADDDRSLMALRTPLYLILAAIGVLILVATFLPWATVDVGASDITASGIETSYSGTDAGGWGAASIITGLAIAIIGVIGYFWNPFSDPEALFIGGFALAAIIAALVKMGDLDGFVEPTLVDFFNPSTGIGLWLILVGAIASFAGAAWIVVSRPRAEARLG